MRISRVIAAVAAAGGLAAAPTVADADFGGRTVAYRVTIENVATGFQPLSPAGVAVHSRWTDVWSTGAPASNAVAAVAKDANGGVFADTYSQVHGVEQACVGGAAPAGPGGTIEFGEGPEDALVRVVREETGLDVVIDARVGSWIREGFRPMSRTSIAVTSSAGR